jgi:bifunctional DNA-binding transcriptional regulator/antitoxin component of YhaV-PrlF toxin-antitoxin module
MLWSRLPLYVLFSSRPLKQARYTVPKVEVHGNQVTLPDSLRRVLTSADDDAIEAEEVDEGILLKRSPEAQRAAGLADIRAAQAGVRYVCPKPRPGAEEEERQIADMLAAIRRMSGQRRANEASRTR